MKLLFFLISLGFLFQSCSTKTLKSQTKSTDNSTFRIAFGSCSDQDSANILWKEITANQAALWIWGGDLIYSEIKNIEHFRSAYQKQKKNADYQEFLKKTKVLGTWDDHDYGVNDGGLENPKKELAQEIFLDFFDIPQNDPRRKQEGVYYSELFEVGKNKSVNVILLDTRYFRSSLTLDKDSQKRYKSNEYGEGTMLGDKQWKWLEKELTNSEADFNVIVSSIQFLSYLHRYETWGNMPHQVDKMKALIRDSGAKGTFILSGDRHFSEISKTNVEGLAYPLYDFTSSGLTHTYSKTKDENPLRVSKLVNVKSFGLLKFNFEKKSVIMEMRGKKNILLDSFEAQF